ncbi:MAG: SGNH/GDSL hydrolase family protein [Herbiconiux sp.]|nr:SGNH/GDSL hydrolase family protein [Herbiconiux sp.]
MSRLRARTLLAVAAVCAVIALVAAGVSVWAVATDAGRSADAASVAGPPEATASPGSRLTRTIGSPERTADFSFGHTIGHLQPSPGAAIDASMRLPFELGVNAGAFRVHVRNWQFDSEQVFDSPVTLTGLYVGKQREGGTEGLTGEFAGTPTGLVGTANLPAEGYVTEWIDPSRFDLQARTSYLLAVGFQAAAGATLATTPGISWLAVDGGGSARAPAAGVQGELGSLSYFDIWIEYSYAGDAPVLLSVGHSLNAPGNGDEAAFPTRGQKTSWPQQWALGNRAVAASMAAPGSQTPVFNPQAAKWDEFAGIEPDIVTVWAASNDIARGRPLADIQRDWSAILDTVHARWPDAVVYAMTEPPRSLGAAEEQTRLAWNDWLAGLPGGLDGLIDADRALRDPFAPSQLRSDVDADGVHFNARGHALIAQLLPAPRIDPAS